jgi:hypothetical protein
MASRKQSTRNSASATKADCHVLSSTTQFERWENRKAKRKHLFLGKSNNTQKGHAKRIPTNVLSCWEVNMGFDERGIISTDFNDVDSWLVRVTPCCHCITFQYDRPLKKSLKAFSSHHDIQIAERYQCQTLWATKGTRMSGTKNDIVSKRACPEALDDIPSECPLESGAKKQKNSSIDKEKIVPDVHISMSKAGLTLEDTSLETWEAMEQLEMKLKAKYEYDLSEYKIENAKLTAIAKTGVETVKEALLNEKLMAIAKTDTEKVKEALEEEFEEKCRQFEAEKGVLEVALEEKKQENVSLSLENQELDEKLQSAVAEKIRASSRTYVQQLEDCTRRNMQVGLNRKWAAERLADVIRKDAYGGLCGNHLEKTIHDEIQKANPYKDGMEVCRVLDMGSGQLNLSGLEMLRKGIEGDENGKVKYGGGWLSSKYFLQKAQKKVNEAAKLEIPFIEIPTPDLDGIVFKEGIDDFSKLLMFLLEMFKLDGIARDPTQPPVQIAATLDGADISRNVSHVTAGIKILDPRAIDPISHLPIGMDGSKKVQSRELCFPFKMILTRDTKSLYQEHFKDFFDFFGRLRDEGLPTHGIRPMMVSSPQDMSSIWKAIGRGGGCKNKTFFCYCCAATSKDSAKPRKIQCQSCIEKGRSKCYHSDMGDVSTLARLHGDLQEMTTTHQFLQFEDTSQTLAELQSHLDPSQFEKEKDQSNIDFVASSDHQKREHYLHYLKPDLSLLGLSLMGTYDERVGRLCTALELMTKKIDMETTMRITGEQAGALLMLRQAIPCILHCENRCGEKFIKMFLLEIFNHFDGDTDTQEQFLKQFEEFVNLNVLGKPWRKANWRLHTTENVDKQKTIGDQGMPNTHVRKFIDAFDELADNFMWHDEERKIKWKQCIAEWKLVMEMARQREDFSDEEIDQFGNQCDVFFELWVDLTQLQGMTNYFHMIGSGHMTYYLREWRNLYRYSQQGWEALNSLLKNIYFRRTQRGGHKGDGSTRNSKLEPIANWIQRRLFFMSKKYKNIQ